MSRRRNPTEQTWLIGVAIVAGFLLYQSYNATATAVAPAITGATGGNYFDEYGNLYQTASQANASNAAIAGGWVPGTAMTDAETVAAFAQLQIP